MNTMICSLTILSLLGGGATLSADSKTFKKFSNSDAVISNDLKGTGDDQNSWMAECSEPQTLRLFELTEPGVNQCLVIYRAKLKTEGLEGKAYLEMWCRFPGKGEFFSRGLQNPVSGSNNWASYETPFFLKKGEKPDLIKLNLVVKGTGKIWIKDVEVLTGPLPKAK